MSIYRVEITETTIRTIWVSADDEVEAYARAAIKPLEKVREKECYWWDDLKSIDHKVSMHKETDQETIKRLEFSDTGSI